MRGQNGFILFCPSELSVYNCSFLFVCSGDDGSVDGSSPGKHEQTDKESSSQEDDQDDMTPDLPPPITLSRPWEDLTVSDIIDPGQFMVILLDLEHWPARLVKNRLFMESFPNFPIISSE